MIEPTAGQVESGLDAGVAPPAGDEGEPVTRGVVAIPVGDGSVAGTGQDVEPEPEAALATTIPPMADFRMAIVSAVTVDLPNQHPTVVLRETESPCRQLSFSIGMQDAVVMSHAMRRIPTPRPLTLELMSSVLQSFDVDVVAVRMVGRQGSIYFAELDLRGRSGRSVLSCRPSDGLSLALLQPVPVPILIDRRLLEESGDITPA
jgi:bifunctional DNase/RNase